MRVCLVAAPLMARSGVYRSALDLVEVARREGHDWSAVIGVRPEAAGTPSTADGISERTIRAHGRGLLPEIGDLLASSPAMTSADAVVSLIPQSDMVIARREWRAKHRVAWVRGLPWPDRGEQSELRRRLLTGLERRALRAMSSVWATSALLAEQIGAEFHPVIVPAGVPDATPSALGGVPDGPLVWAGRLSPEKGAREFVAVVRDTGLPGRLHGTGPLEQELRIASPPNLQWAGWSTPDSLLDGASVFLATSHRDAFGRTPVEAAMAGIPVVLSDQVGAAPLLYTDPELRSRFVLPLAEIEAWRAAAWALREDAALRARVSRHLRDNAARLTIRASMRAAHERLAEAVDDLPCLSESEMLH